MNSLTNLRVATRMQILVGLTLVGLLVLCLSALLQLKNSMLEDRKQTTKDIVEVGMGIIAHHHKLNTEGKLSEADAKNAARDALRGLRYGKDDYFFGFDTTGTYYLHGANPSGMEGKLKIDLKDVNGKLVVKELITVAQAGGGFVDFWFPRAGQQQPEPKLGYAKLFTPWNWVLSTGIYIDDVDTEYRKNALLLGGISGVLLLALIVFGWMVSNSVLRQLGGEPKLATAIMQRVAGRPVT